MKTKSKMKNIELKLNETWLSRKYYLSGVLNEPSEINTSLSCVSVPSCSHSNMIIDGDFFAQGEEADNIISEIHKYWLNNNCTADEAFKFWVNSYL